MAKVEMTSKLFYVLAGDKHNREHILLGFHVMANTRLCRTMNLSYFSLSDLIEVVCEDKF